MSNKNTIEIILDEDVITQDETITKSETKNDNGKVLVLMNDDENSFDFVEECLIQICKHTPQQAHDSAMTVHTRGKCDIYKGNTNKLQKMMWALQLKGLLVTIENG